MQYIEAIYQIFAQFLGFIEKYRFQSNFSKKKFLEKKADNSNYRQSKLGDFWTGLTGLELIRTHFWKKIWEAQISHFFAI